MTEQQSKRKSKKIGWFGGGLLAIILVLVAVPVYVLILVSDSYILVEEAATIKADSATKAKNIAKTVYNNLNSPNSTDEYRLTLSQADINGVIALAMRGVNGLTGRVNVTSVGIRGVLSFKVPQNPFGDYINVSGMVVPSDYGLHVDSITIGSLEVSGGIAVFLAEKLLNLVLGGEATGSKLISSIESIQVSGSALTIKYHPIPGFKQAIRQTKGKVKNIRNSLALLAKPEDVKAYYQNICNLHAKIEGLGKVSLGYYLSDTFILAGQRASISKLPIEENKAAILALSIFLGEVQFDSLIGAIDKETLEKCQPRDNKVVLANRIDLRLHFIFSAALKIFSDSNMSFAIGEFKELLDSGKGGTGFSFSDLAADRSGIRFAEFAVSKTGAFRLQRLAAKLTQENVFFPSLSELRDGISQNDFKVRGGLDGQFYKQNLAIINQRIDRLPLYQ